MKPEKIREIARRFTVPEVVGTKEWPMVYWEFCEEELIAFAQSVIEADRQRIKQIIDEVGRQGSHDKWFDCADAIAGRFEQ